MNSIFTFRSKKQLKFFFLSVFILATFFAITPGHSQQTITGTTAGNKVLIVKGAAAQTGNLQDWQNSAGTTLSNFDASGNLTVPSLRLNNSNTSLTQGSGNSLRTTTNSGYVEIGPQNTGWAHFTTDRAQYYFDRQVGFNGHAFPYTDNTYDLGNGIASAWRDFYLDRMIYANGTAGTNGQVLTSNGTNVYWAAAAGGSDNLGNHTATTTLSLAGNIISNTPYIDITPGEGYGLRFWSSDLYAINMGTSAEFNYGAVTGYSIKSNMNNDATRGWTWGVDATAPIASINTQGILSLANRLQIDGNTVIDDGGGWHRSYGQTGWYNGTYGGGMWMSDASWVRTYGGKNFFCDATVQMGDLTTDNHYFFGTLWSGSQSDAHQINPSFADYGYVGNASYYWFYMYSNNFINVSKRELKRNIIPVENNFSELVMKDIDKIKPSFYKYKSETDNREEGNEPKYRPNMHLGVILDESPDYIQDNAFSGIDIYGLSTMTMVGVKHNREEIKKIKELIGMANNQVEVNDFGVSKINGTKVVVTFNKDFKGSTPVVTVTPNSLGSSLAVTDITTNSFTVESSQSLSNISFNWIACGNVKLENNKKDEPIPADLLKSLKVDQSIKLNVKKYWETQSVKQIKKE